MNLNLSLLGQMITFIVFVVFTMKYVWPPLTKAMQDRQKKIADGLAAAEQGIRDLELAQRKTDELLDKAKHQAAHMLDEAGKRAAHMVDEAKEAAQVEGQRLLEQARLEIEQEVRQAKEGLRKQVGALVIDTAEKVLRDSIDATQHEALIKAAIQEL